MKLTGKIIVVTGVSSGVGSEVARLARCEGARVIGSFEVIPLVRWIISRLRMILSGNRFPVSWVMR
ncbi:hypothetical protein ACVDG5_035760 [Mesorhizobium sp. ORM6]